MDAVCISAYTVETSPVGFNRCWWPANSIADAERIAKDLSLQHSDNPTYPNAFWVVDCNGKSLAKYFRGQRYNKSETI